jgi:hypothetical protein
MSIEYFCKHIEVEDLNDMTFGFFKKEIAIRKKELATENHKGLKLCMDADQWVLKVTEDFHITIMVPAQRI